MALISMFPRSNKDQSDADATARGVAILGLRSESVQRLQVGLSGIAGMILLVGLAQVIFDRAQESEAAAVPAAAATVAPATSVPTQSDPLVEAGVVPDLPEPALSPTQEPAVMPEQGAPVPAE